LKVFKTELLSIELTPLLIIGMPVHLIHIRSCKGYQMLLTSCKNAEHLN